MSRKKRLRFAELEEMCNVVDERRCESGWFDTLFEPEQAVALELGCGRGEYTLALARSRPDRGVLGVDRNGARLWSGAGQALHEGLTNAFFLRGLVEHLEDHIPGGRIDEIWLPFPDPLPKTRQARHRLVSPVFLERYRRLLRPGAAVHLRTDDSDLLGFADRAVRSLGGRVTPAIVDLATDAESVPLVQTRYERRYRIEGRTIYGRTFHLD